MNLKLATTILYLSSITCTKSEKTAVIVSVLEQALSNEYPTRHNSNDGNGTTNHNGSGNHHDEDKMHKTDDESSTCTYYLAPSSIPNAGFGVYTTKAIKEKTPLLKTPDGPSIMITDGDTHYNNGERNWSLENYFWGGEGDAEFEADDVEMFEGTLVTSSNYHTFLKNIRPNDSEYDDTITPRSSGSPGIGAYSYYQGQSFHTSRDIEAGEEIFADYGEDYLEFRQHLHKVPRREDHMHAGRFLLNLLQGLESDQIDGSYVLIYIF